MLECSRRLAREDRQLPIGPKPPVSVDCRDDGRCAIGGTTKISKPPIYRIRLANQHYLACDTSIAIHVTDLCFGRVLQEVALPAPTFLKKHVSPRAIEGSERPETTPPGHSTQTDRQRDRPAQPPQHTANFTQSTQATRSAVGISSTPSTNLTSYPSTALP